MKKREIRCPKFCAVMFLLSALSSFLSVGTQLFEHFVLTQNSVEFLNIAKYIVSGSAALFVSIILFKKRYDKLLLGAVSGLVVSGIFSTIVYGVTEHSFSFSVLVDVLVFFIVLAFVCDCEKGKLFAIKTRFAVPVINFIVLLIEGIFIGANISKKLNVGMNIVTVFVAVVVFVPVIVLSVVNYYKLVAWVMDPYEQTKVSKKKKESYR